LIHELGHATAIRRYQLPTSITLWAFGGYATFPPNRLTRLQSFLVTIAGPGVQLLAGILALFLGRLLPIPEGSLFGPFLGNFVLVSVVWAVLNCLPVYPMDGGQMLSAVLGPSRQRLVYLLSAVTALMVGLAGYAYLGTILLPIFMALFAWQNWQSYRQTA
jgi:Zn-dependent protease